MSDNGPKIPIPGVAGATIFSALQSLALYCGEATVTITKARVAGGGYSYWVSNLTTPRNGAGFNLVGVHKHDY
jgi:hypothetical protein